MFKYVALLGALALAAPGLAIADNNQPPSSLTDLTANDPPASSFNGNGPPNTPPGHGGFPPGCTILGMDKDDNNNGQNGDDKKSAPGNPNCPQPASP
jgi:hypothetical protein